MVAVSGGDAVLSFNITNAIPMVQISDIRWYYSANSEDFEDITDLMNRTSVSNLDLSPDRLTLKISNIVQAIGDVMETDQGRYFLNATNPAGERSNYIDVVVRGKLLAINRTFVLFYIVEVVLIYHQVFLIIILSSNLSFIIRLKWF